VRSFSVIYVLALATRLLINATVFWLNITRLDQELRKCGLDARVFCPGLRTGEECSGRHIKHGIVGSAYCGTKTPILEKFFGGYEFFARPFQAKAGIGTD